jgi:hypothetical protein
LGFNSTLLNRLIGDVNMFRFCSFLLAFGFVAGWADSSTAVTVTDTYWGGTNTWKPGNGDVIGDKNVFGIDSMDVDRVANGNLVVTIHTAFAGRTNSDAALGYGYGALFFSTTGVTLDNSSPNYGTDKYVAGRFDYAFVIPEKPGKGDRSGSFAVGATTGGLFALKADGSDIKLATKLNSDHYVRKGQAVRFINDGAQTALRGGSWSVDSLNDTIQFIIEDGGLLGTQFALSWTMTCGNDVIFGSVSLPNDGPGPGPDPVPLPAGFILFATGAAAFGLIARRSA